MSTGDDDTHTLKRRIGARLLPSPRVLVTAVATLLAVGALGFSTMSALGAFNAVITNSGTFTAGSIVLEETGTQPSSNTCYSSASASGQFTNSNSYSCSTVDVFGAATGQLPGVAATTQQLTFTNAGSSNASSFTMLPGATCTASPSGTYYGNDTGSFCNHVDVTIGNSAGTVCYYPAQASACPALSNTYNLHTLAALGSAVTIGSGLNAGANTVVYVKTELDGIAATNEDMGLQASVGFTWTLSQ
jgi:hypothetical protein